MNTLFNYDKQKNISLKPLADRLRPNSLDDVLGQEHIIWPDKIISKMIDAHKLSSLIFWGPPGSGKTTIAKLISNKINYDLISIPAVFSGLNEIKKAIIKSELNRESGKSTIVFVDEIHRFTSPQQDSFLQVIEEGELVLIGATTENPSFHLNNALLSRCQVLPVKKLNHNSLLILLDRAEYSQSCKLPLDKDARLRLVEMADGDGRYILSLAEILFNFNLEKDLDSKALKTFLQDRAPNYDKLSDQHFNLISALHKSIRGSDPDSSLYWLARMLISGEDPFYILRRLLRIASEDIGLTDPNAIKFILNAKEGYEFIGYPEGEILIVQAVIYLATSKKSNSVYNAYKKSFEIAKKYGSLPPPSFLINSNVYEDAKGTEEYIYDHSLKDKFSGQNYMPKNIQRTSIYKPSKNGYEYEIHKRMKMWEYLRLIKKN